jgi:transcriptional regulator with XRE-family HTH domain
MELVLKKVRLEKGFTQIQMSDRLGISIRTYQRIENNERKPSYDVILQLQNIFNESINNLLETF